VTKAAASRETQTSLNSFDERARVALCDQVTLVALSLQAGQLTDCLDYRRVNVAIASTDAPIVMLLTPSCNRGLAAVGRLALRPMGRTVR